MGRFQRADASNYTAWLPREAPADSCRLRMFCFPHAGGGAIAFHSWRRLIPSYVQLCPVVLPGRESRLGEQPYIEMEELIEALNGALRPWLDRPFVLFGHSMGALIAFAWARRLKRGKIHEPSWIVLSGRAAPAVAPVVAPGSEPGQELMHRLADDEFLRELMRRYDGIPQELLSDPEMVKLFLPVLRADITLVETYRCHAEPILEIPMTVFGGVDDSSATAEQLMAWPGYTRGPFELKLLPGGHFYPQTPLLQALLTILGEIDGSRAAIPAAPERNRG